MIGVIKVKLTWWSSWFWWSGCSGGQSGWGGWGAQVVGLVEVLRWLGLFITYWLTQKLSFSFSFMHHDKKDILQTQILVSYAFRKWFLMQCLQKDQNSCSGDALNNVKCDNPQNDLQFSNISLLYLKTSLWYPSPYILKYSHLLSGRCVWFSPMRPAVWLVCHTSPHHVLHSVTQFVTQCVTHDHIVSSSNH